MQYYDLQLYPHHITSYTYISQQIDLKQLYSTIKIANVHYRQALLYFTYNGTFFRITASGYITILGSRTIEQVRHNFYLMQDILRRQIPDLTIYNFSVYQTLITGNFHQSVDLLRFADVTGGDFEPEIGFGARYRKIENGKRFIINVQANGRFVVLGCKSMEEAIASIAQMFYEHDYIETCFR